MSTPPAPAANVIDFGRRQAASSVSSASGLLGRVQQTARIVLTPALEQAFQAADDDLFKRSENNPMLFEGLRELRKRQALIARRFLDRLEQKPGDTPPRMTDRASAETSLSLVNDQQLEETLAVSRMVGATDAALAGEIHALRQRMAVLRGGVDPSTVAVPLLPQAVASAFEEALRDLEEIPLPLRIVLYKHFERHTMGALGPLYNQVNQELSEAGVLPDLRPQPLVHSSATLPEETLHSSRSVAPDSTQLTLTAEERAAWHDFRQALAAQRTPGSGGYGPAASVRDLTDAIAALREIQAMLGQLTATGVAPQEVKQHLLAKLGQGTAAAKSLGTHEDAIDTVGLVFEHILGDPNLPAPIQALLARLHVPFLKAAVIDAHLFARTEHPARQLLDLLGEFGKGWTEESDRDRTLFNRIKDVVETVNHEFVDDPRIFERQREAFEAFVAELSQRAAVSRQRSEDVAKSRDRLEHAQSLVTADLAARTAGKALPDWARTLMLRHWAGHLVLVVVREGASSPAYKKALGLVEQTVGAHGIETPAEKQALALATPALVQQLQEGLASMGLAPDELRNLVQAFRGYLDTNTGMGALPLPPLPVLAATPAPALRVPERKAPKARPEFIAAAARLRVDDWIEFTDDNGRRTRGKVSWISSFTHRLLFVTFSGMRLMEKSQEDLAWMLERGTARAIETKPLFCRALESIAERLRR